MEVAEPAQADMDYASRTGWSTGKVPPKFLLTLWEANNSMIAKARAASTGIDDPYGESKNHAAGDGYP